jgi:hypothetical protein
MSRLTTGISGAIALVLISGAAQFALGRDLGMSPADQLSSVSPAADASAVNRCHANGFAEAERLFGYYLPASCSRDLCHSHRGVVDGQASCAQTGGSMRAHGQRIDRSCETT